jgi:putative ABC transport system ATP-binding protein
LTEVSGVGFQVSAKPLARNAVSLIEDESFFRQTSLGRTYRHTPFCIAGKNTCKIQVSSLTMSGIGVKMTIVECLNVNKTYRQGQVEVQALKDINLAINKGDFVAVAGPSGSGKTTLLNLIGGLDSVDSGRIVLDGNLFEQMSPSQLAALRLHKVGFVFQAYNLIPVLSAAENVEFVMLLQGIPAPERRARAKAILDDVGLSDKYNRRPAELSGGQQQRVAVARAIVSNPSIVLADEPTANLDSTTGEGLLAMMQQMNREKEVTFIFSTHDKMVMDYARRLVLIRDGRIEDDRNK